MNRIVITGASSDIGLAVYKRIVKCGDKVILHCFSHEEKLTAISKELDESVKVIRSDFRKTDELKMLCNQIQDTDILINIAALTKTDLLVNLSEEDIMDMININIYAMTIICKSVLTRMTTKRKGCIINISSVAAQRGNKGQSVYAGTKGFVESFTRSLAAEYGPRGIRVNAVAPGPIATGSLKELLAYADEEVKQSIVLKRLGTAEDVANAVDFLCGDNASFINGKILSVDGGFCKGV